MGFNKLKTEVQPAGLNRLYKKGACIPLIFKGEFWGWLPQKINLKFL